MWITIPVVMLHRFMLDVNIRVGRWPMRHLRWASVMTGIKCMCGMMQVMHRWLLMWRRHRRSQHARFRSRRIIAILHHFMARTRRCWMMLLYNLVVKMAARDHSGQGRYSSVMIQRDLREPPPFVRKFTVSDR